MTQRRVEARSASFLLFLMAAVLRRASSATAWGPAAASSAIFVGCDDPGGRGSYAPLLGPFAALF
jgi:hypothetical protein